MQIQDTNRILKESRISRNAVAASHPAAALRWNPPIAYIPARPTANPATIAAAMSGKRRAAVFVFRSVIL